MKIQLSDHFTYPRLLRFVAPSIVMMVFTSVYGVVDGFFVSNFVGKTPFAAVNLIWPFLMLIGGVGFMLGAGGSAPLVSYHYGAENRAELQNLLRKSIFLMSGGGVLMVLIAQGLAAPLGRLFVGYDPALLDITVHAFRISTLSFALVGCNIFASSFFTALNNGGVSAAISFLRTFVFKLSAVLILPLLLQLDGIWWAEVTAEVFAFLLSAAFLIAKRNKYRYF